MLLVNRNTPPSALELKVGKAVRRRYCWALTFTAKQVSQSDVRVLLRSGILLNLVHPYLLSGYVLGKWRGGRTYGIGDDDVDASELGDCVGDHTLTVCFDTLIGLKGKSLDGVFAGELLGQFLSCFLGGLVVDSHIGALFGEFLADNGTEAAGSGYS